MQENLPEAEANNPAFTPAPMDTDYHTVVAGNSNHGSEYSPSPKKFPIKKILIIFFALFLIIAMTGGGVMAYRWYYSPDRILQSAVINSTKLKDYEYDIKADISVTNSSTSRLFNLSTLTIRIDGKSVLSTGRQFENEANISISTNMGDGAVSLISKNSKLYAKLNSVPATLAFFDLSQVINKWVFVDFTEYVPKAEELSKEIENNEVTDEQINEIIKLWNDYPLITVTDTLASEQINGESTFHYAFKVNTQNANMFALRAEEILTGEEAGQARRELAQREREEIDVKGEIWIGKKSKQVLKTTVAMVYEDMGIDIAANVKNHNKGATINEPTDYLTVEEFLALLESSSSDNPLIDGLLDSDTQSTQYNDTQRRSDLLQITNAVYQFAAEHNGELPDNFPEVKTEIGTCVTCYNLAAMGEAGKETIVPKYLETMPYDPSTGNATNTGYYIYVSESWRVVAEATGEVSNEPIIVTR